MLAAIGVVLAVITAVVRAGIVGSAHDFSNSGWSGGEVCAVCHTPHDAERTAIGGPAWNHKMSAATYTLYSSPTMKATVGQPTGVSKLCLSCHDGTVALDSFGGKIGSTTIKGSALIGTDLNAMHPISFRYDSALASRDSTLYDPSSKSSGIGSTIDRDMLYDGKMECATCHDVHDRHGNDHLLRMTDAGSALCLTCHNR